MSKNVTIIGAGIVGLATAWAFHRKGYRVEMVDRAGISEMASRGNAGALAYSEILPLASPRILRQAPKWLLDPMGPLAVPPSYLPRLLPWLWHFWRASFPKNVRRSISALSDINVLSERENKALLDELDLNSELRPVGALYLYESQGEERHARGAWRFRDEIGIDYAHLDQPALREVEPALSHHFTGATRVPGWTLVSDPYRFGCLIGERLIAAGVSFHEANVQAISYDAERPVAHLDNGTQLASDSLIIAAGAWSNRLTAPLGQSFPLEVERGYNTTIPEPGITVRHELIFSGHGFVASPLDCGFRVGGADEFAGLDRPPDYRRSKAMLTKAKRFLPGLQSNGGQEWMGHRPSLPDSLPVIGAANFPNLYLGFGHGHLGLTQAAATGRLLTEIVDGSKTTIDAGPFDPRRFN